jgi:hypothetical protein
MGVNFKLEPILDIAPAATKIRLALKVVNNDSKMLL